MQAFSWPALLDLCCDHLESGQLGPAGAAALRRWWSTEQEGATALAEALVSRPAAEWTGAILEHRAHRHPWYDALARDVTLGEFACFMLENRSFPAFLPLARRALPAIVQRDAMLGVDRQAIRRHRREQLARAGVAQLVDDMDVDRARWIVFQRHGRPPRRQHDASAAAG